MRLPALSSTYAKLLTGLLKPAKGSVTVDGKPVDVWQNPARLIAYHFQNPDLQLFGESVDEELSNCGAAREMQETVIETFGLKEVLQLHPLDLPFVLRKRVALAATICMNRPWVILDEPTLGQDSEAATNIARILKSLVASGTGVIIISHCEWFDHLVDARPLSISGGRVLMGSPT